MGHFHAAAFPSPPPRKGAASNCVIPWPLIFDTHSLQAVLHLLCDPREINGTGESEDSSVVRF